ncbi:MAG: transcriptional regulator [Myxococcaceae bacterium]|nr:transcriptional regulator [Myxococcaceae bacterium]
MSRPRHALVLGKFYPPHAGHHLLVRTAAEACERVTVLVLAASVESIPLPVRVGWMQEIHRAQPNVTIVGGIDDHPVDYRSDAVWRLHVELFQQLLGAPVDAVFTSEPYGEELGRRLNAKAVCVDLGRSAFPYSGTAVRADPVGTWDALAEPVRGWFARRVVLVGAESTGKTTLAEELAGALRRRGGAHRLTRWVPEVGREVTAQKLARLGASAAPEDVSWQSADFVAIAQAQSEREDALARLGGPVLVCDTDAFATGIWHERYQGVRSTEVEALATAHPLYLLTHPDDVPFTQDGLRDGEQIRDWMTARFVQRLEETQRRYVLIRGGRDERLQRCLLAIDQLLAEGWRLADPLG